MGDLTDPDVDYIDEYNKMFGWRTYDNDRAAYYASIEKWEYSALIPLLSSGINAEY